MLLPPLAEILKNAVVVDLPLQKSFRGLTRRSALLFEGPSGWAEFAPFANHSVSHSSRWLQAAIEQSYGEWLKPLANSVPINAILPELDLAETADWVKQLHGTAGCTIFKFKSAENFATDLRRIEIINQTASDLGFVPQLRLDVNGQWDLETAKINFQKLTQLDSSIEYIEQPVASLRELSQLKKVAEIPIAIDETLRLSTVLDFDAIESVADVVVVKAIPLGGIAAANRIIQQLSKPVVVSGSLDTSVGLAAGIFLAASQPNPMAAGLGTDFLFAKKITSSPHGIENGQIEVKRVVPDLAHNHLAETETAKEWQTRLTECYEFLEQQ